MGNRESRSADAGAASNFSITQLQNYPITQFAMLTI
jgi:hypothetical protein